MNPGYIPKLSLANIESPFKLPGMSSMPPMSTTSEVQGPTFKDALSGLVQNVNATMTEPDNLMQAAMTTGGADVHDVMIANAKAELTVNITAQVATKVVQAYDRILQIQI